MFAALNWRFGAMKTKLLAQAVEPNGNAPTKTPSVCNTASTLTNAEVSSLHAKNKQITVSFF
jgi:hypothetical protein